MYIDDNTKLEKTEVETFSGIKYVLVLYAEEIKKTKMILNINKYSDRGVIENVLYIMF